MSKTFLLIAMIFAHIVDDYYLQGWLASAKQRGWWETNAPDELYRFDYIAALAMHSMSWSFMILFPIALSKDFFVGVLFGVVFALNAVIHGIVDNLKANIKKINLIQDQAIHILQIIATFLIFCIE